MSDLLTLKKIREDLASHKINKLAASKIVELIISESDNEEIRAKAIEIFGDFSIKTEKVFKLLEKGLVSDESPLVRFSSAKIMIQNFPNHENSPLFWVIENEKSIYFFKKLLDLLETIISKDINEIRLKSNERVKNIYRLNPEDARFILDIDFIEYLKFKKEFKNFLEKFKVKETHQKKLIKENTEIGYKGLGRVKSSKQGYITGLVLTDLDEIPQSITLLSKLESLSINRCKLKKLPNLSSSLQRLKYLNLSDNQLQNLPEWVFEFSKKEINTEKYVKQGVLHSEAPLLALLETLAGNEIIKTDKFIQASQTYGHYFSLDKNGFIVRIFIKNPQKPKIGILPRQICNLNNLEEIYFVNQNIRKIPMCINQLKVLKILDLRGNNIEKIPKSIQKLEILKL
ncbi:hypothetical protein AC481_00305 [miscellaneous Crenarchaeota group archaeon SMTZ-80]|nr:MAG: hypothetical protein AC481_00305 [miscellaneous Crenarchaeota group archaeon SMTZ-80]